MNRDFLETIGERLPARVREHLICLTGITRRASYSQDGEDMVLRAFLDEDRVSRGFYVDVGAYHPTKHSNTRYFYARGWRGINIDATPGSMRLFRRYRSRDINLELAIAETDGDLTLYTFSTGGLNSINANMSLLRSENPHFRMTGQVVVKAMPLSKVLDEHLPAGRTIDFLDVDVEGADLEVLKSNNWDKYRPRYVLAEVFDTLAKGKREAFSRDVCDFLMEREYEMCGRTLRTGIFRDQKR